MNPPYDPDLDPTTTSPVELRYFDVLRGILDQVKQTGSCIVPAHHVGTCYSPNIPLSLQNDSRVLKGSTLDLALSSWVASQGLVLSTSTDGIKTYRIYHPIAVPAPVLTPTQQFVATCLAAGADDVLLFDNNHYSVTNGIGKLTSAAGTNIYWTAPSLAATNDLAIITDGTGPNSLPYMAAGGVSGTLVASANQTVAHYYAVLRVPPPLATWKYGSIIDGTGTFPATLGLLDNNNTTFYSGTTPRAVSRNGTALVAPYDCTPVNEWMVLSVATYSPSLSQICQLFAAHNQFFATLCLAALAVRYTDPTEDQQSSIEHAASILTNIPLLT